VKFFNNLNIIIKQFGLFLQLQHARILQKV